jgi:hypothetical protein
MPEAMNPQDKPTDNTWSVLVIDMFHYMDPEEGERLVTGFLKEEDAVEYARRRTRSSVEECRPSAPEAAALRSAWLMFGEDCIALGTGYKGFAELDEFIAHPATPEEIDWVSLEPDLRMRTVLLHVARTAKGASCSEA